MINEKLEFLEFCRGLIDSEYQSKRIIISQKGYPQNVLRAAFLIYLYVRENTDSLVTLKDKGLKAFKLWFEGDADMVEQASHKDKIFTDPRRQLGSFKSWCLDYLDNRQVSLEEIINKDFSSIEQFSNTMYLRTCFQKERRGDVCIYFPNAILQQIKQKCMDAYNGTFSLNMFIPTLMLVAYYKTLQKEKAPFSKSEFLAWVGKESIAHNWWDAGSLKGNRHEAITDIGVLEFDDTKSNIINSLIDLEPVTVVSIKEGDLTISELKSDGLYFVDEGLSPHLKDGEKEIPGQGTYARLEYLFKKF